MTIQTIVKKAIKRLELEGKSVTPEFYLEAFCKEAQKAGIVHDDCTQLDKFKNSLNKEFQAELTKYNIKTVSELIRFLVSKLNRTNTSHCSKLLESQTELTKKILNAITVLHNKQASDLAINSLKLLSGDSS
ncbi:MAG: GGDEF domain-containing protein, partial [Campylobacterales bacterium]|nr:GGDEF domain-containing protein [Campylobacterales bacterium]